MRLVRVLSQIVWTRQAFNRDQIFRNLSEVKVFAFSLRIVTGTVLLFVLLAIPSMPALAVPLIMFSAFAAAMNWVGIRVKSNSTKDLTPLRKSSSDYALKFQNLEFTRVNIGSLQVGDEVLCESDRLVPADGHVIDGMALVDESAITGESAPVIRDSTPERRFVTEGARILTNRILVQISRRPKFGLNTRIQSLLDERKAPESRAELEVRSWVTISIVISVIAVAVAVFLCVLAGSISEFWKPLLLSNGIALICLAPLWFLPRLQRFLSIAYMDRLIHKNLIPKNTEILELAGAVKTMVFSRPQEDSGASRIEVKHLIPSPDISMERLAKTAQLASLADETEPNKAIVAYVKSHFGFLAQSLEGKEVQFVSSLDEKNLCGMNIFSDEGEDGMRSVLIGSMESIRRHVERLGGVIPETLKAACETILGLGDESSLVCDGRSVVGVVHFSRRKGAGVGKEVVGFGNLGIRVISLIPKENNLLPMVRAEDASERLDVVRKLQASGEPIAFIGQSAIDAPGLAQANLSLVANVGNESLMSLSHVANASGDQWRFRHLFILGKELNLRRTDLTALCIASATAVWIAVIPYFGETVTGVEAKLSWITNPLGFSSLSAAIISAGFVTSMNLLLMASSIIGLHDKEGRFFRWANLLFSGPSRTLQTFVFSLIALKILAVLTTF